MRAQHTAGDANILDQVKLGPDERTVGRVNINTTSPKVIKGMLTGLRVGTSYALPLQGGTAIAEGTSTSTPGATLIAKATGATAGYWLFENGAAIGSTGVPFRSRGELARITTITDGSCGVAQTTDAMQEEIIGKLAAISTVRPNYFTIFVVSQVIKDLPEGVPNGTSHHGSYDVNDKIMAEQRIMATVWRDSFSNRFQLLRLDYLDE